MNGNSPATAWKEARRFIAFELGEEGWGQRDIAEMLGVSEGAVSQWMKIVRLQGPAALAARPHTGAPRRLDDDQCQELLKLLTQGAVAYGFRGEVWSCPRIACVIAREFGVSYHQGHVWRLLKRLGWTLQKPCPRAAQRQQAQITRWRNETWPRLKRGH